MSSSAEYTANMVAPTKIDPLPLDKTIWHTYYKRHLVAIADQNLFLEHLLGEPVRPADPPEDAAQRVIRRISQQQEIYDQRKKRAWILLTQITCNTPLSSLLTPFESQRTPAPAWTAINNYYDCQGQESRQSMFLKRLNKTKFISSTNGDQLDLNRVIAEIELCCTTLDNLPGAERIPIPDALKKNYLEQALIGQQRFLTFFETMDSTAGNTLSYADFKDRLINSVAGASKRKELVENAADYRITQINNEQAEANALYTNYQHHKKKYNDYRNRQRLIRQFPSPQDSTSRPAPQGCTFCGNPNHTDDDCWSLHPEKRPANNKKRPHQANTLELIGDSLFDDNEGITITSS